MQPIPHITKAPFRIENQLGGTLGGPLHLPRFGEGGPRYISGRDRTFFFFAIQRWWDRQLGIGQALNGAPTAEGKAIINAGAGDLPQVRALLDFLPAAATPLGRNATFVRNGQTFTVPLGSLVGAQSSTYDDWQTSMRIDHRFGEKHNLNGRYLYQDSGALGSIPGVAASQITPPGFSSIVPARTQGVNLQFTSVLSPKWVNEIRGAFLRSAIGNARSRSAFGVDSFDGNCRVGLAWFQCWSNAHRNWIGCEPAAESDEKHLPTSGHGFLHQRQSRLEVWR
jgi:hypothetical protein